MVLKGMQEAVEGGKAAGPSFWGMRVILFSVTVVLPLFLLVYSYTAPAIEIFAPVFWVAVVFAVTLRVVFGFIAKRNPENAWYRALRDAARLNMRMFLITAVLLAVMLPKTLSIRQIESDTRLMSELAKAREDIKKYYQSNGKYPESLTLPAMTIWAATADGEFHFHRAAGQVLIMPGLAKRTWDIDDVGKWAYDPENGCIFFACNGYETKLRQRRLHEL